VISRLLFPWAVRLGLLLNAQSNALFSFLFNPSKHFNAAVWVKTVGFERFKIKSTLQNQIVVPVRVLRWCGELGLIIIPE
jgi:hypothetical protein